jgi:hypothetical protein
MTGLPPKIYAPGDLHGFPAPLIGTIDEGTNTDQSTEKIILLNRSMESDKKSAFGVTPDRLRVWTGCASTAYRRGSRP